MSPKEIIRMWWKSNVDTWKSWREPEFWWAAVLSIIITIWISKL